MLCTLWADWMYLGGSDRDEAPYVFIPASVFSTDWDNNHDPVDVGRFSADTSCWDAQLAAFCERLGVPRGVPAWRVVCNYS